jgi:hypothetical protein
MYLVRVDPREEQRKGRKRLWRAGLEVRLNEGVERKECWTDGE